LETKSIESEKESKKSKKRVKVQEKNRALAYQRRDQERATTNAIQNSVSI